MERQLVTRRVLARELALNAATRPLNVAVPAAVAIAALLLHALWLLPVAVVAYLAMLVSTFFDGDEAERVGRRAYDRSRPPRAALDPWRFAPPIARQLELARAEEERIAESRPDAAVSGEVAELVVELDRLAARAQRAHEFLRTQDDAELRRRLAQFRERADDAASERAARALEERLAVNEDVRAQLRQLEAEMEHVVASLGAIHGELVRLGVGDERETR